MGDHGKGYFWDGEQQRFVEYVSVGDMIEHLLERKFKDHDVVMVKGKAITGQIEGAEITTEWTWKYYVRLSTTRKSVVYGQDQLVLLCPAEELPEL